jgi:hypothetical protein|tara:strand:+ start:1827 stop:2039 length:213 start_codon:yes stop_codon:yes gene_type:complete
MAEDKVSHEVILLKLEQIHTVVSKNTEDIDSLKKQMAMGSGGIKAVFVIGGFIALVLSIVKLITTFKIGT